ncbi:MAG: 50S ribosomal protein L10 [Candidatus Nanoarchaeia archaeon]
MVKKQLTLEEKKEKVAKLAKEIASNISIGVLNLNNLPANQLKNTRTRLKDKIKFYFAKKTLLVRALKESKRKNIEELIPYVEKNNCAILVSNLDAFTFFSELKACEQFVPVKPNQVAPFDLVVPAGPTPFAPGPITSEFAQLGIKTKVEGGKITIREPATVAKKGTLVSALAASMLTRLGIKPIAVVALPTVILENDKIYPASILNVDIEKYAEDLKSAILNGIKLASKISLLSPESGQFMLRLAIRRCIALQNKIKGS